MLIAWKRTTGPRATLIGGDRCRSGFTPLGTSSAAATAYTLAGPSGGLVGSASTNFTVTSNGTLAGSVVVTPSDGGKLGTFTPTTVTLTAGANTSATFTYTPLYYGAITVSATNDGGLADPGGVTYTTTLPSGGSGGGSIFGSSIIKVA